MSEYYETNILPNIIKKHTQVIYDGMKLRNDCLFEKKNGGEISNDMRYLCEYVYPRKIMSAVKELTVLYATQTEELEEVGINTHATI